MIFIAGLLLALAGANALSTSYEEELAPFDSRSGSLVKKELLSCEETYGKDSQQCGPVDSGFCYKPKLGQSCCETDYGFCNAGSYCAPVGGYCCMEGETLEECAAASGFKLPASLISKHKPTTTKKPAKTAATTTRGRVGPTPGDIGKLSYFPTPEPSLGFSLHPSGSGVAAVSDAAFASGTGALPTATGAALPSGTSGVFGGGNDTRPFVVKISSAPPSRTMGRHAMLVGVGLLGSVVAFGIL